MNPIHFKIVDISGVARSDWEDLYSRSDSPNVHYHPIIFEAARETLLKKIKFNLIVGYAGERLVFLLPVRSRKSWILNRLDIIDVPTADHIEPLVDVEVKRVALYEFRRYLTEELRPDVLYARSITEEFKEWLNLSDQSGVCAMSQRFGWTVQLPPEQKQLIENHPTKFRAKIRKVKRRAEKENIRIRVIDSDLMPNAVCFASRLQQLKNLHSLRFESLNRSSFFLRENFQDFHSKFALGLSSKSVNIVFIEALTDDSVFASLYGIVSQNRFTFLMLGFDPSKSYLSPGHLLLTHAMEWLISQGIRSFDFKCGEEDYKKTWADGGYTTIDLVLVLSWQGSVVRKIDALTQWARRIYLSIEKRIFEGPFTRLFPQKP